MLFSPNEECALKMALDRALYMLHKLSSYIRVHGLRTGDYDYNTPDSTVYIFIVSSWPTQQPDIKDPTAHSLASHSVHQARHQSRAEHPQS